MTEKNEKFEQIKILHKSAKLVYEGGNTCVLLPQFTFRSAKQDIRMDLLLYPAAHSGYSTRLFFERKVEGHGANWTLHYVIDRQWWACSWRNVEANMDWTSMLCAHLRAVT